MSGKILFVAFLGLSFFVKAQPLDLNKIKKEAGTETYTKLFNRYLVNDTTLTLDDYVLIYYGSAFKDNYMPNARHDSVSFLNKLIRNAKDSLDFIKALSYSYMILSEFPLDIERIFLNAYVYKQISQNDSSNVWLYKYDKLIRTIMTSGDGESEETAYVVIKVSDEYTLLDAFGLDFEKQALVGKKGKYYDKMTVSSEKKGKEDVYFDVNLFFGKW